MSGFAFLDPDAVRPDKILLWLAAPFLPEHFDDFTLPITADGEPMVMSVRGMVLPQTFKPGAVLSLNGHTSSFNSRFSLERTGSAHRLHGNYNGETMDYVVDIQTGQTTVVGDTGKHHARYTIDSSHTGLRVAGNTSGVHSDYAVTLTAEGLNVKGIDAGENTHYDLATLGTAWHWKGDLAQGFTDLTAVGEGEALILAGTLDSRTCRLVLEPTEGGWRLHGYSTWGPVDYTLTRTESGYRVHGRADHNILDYTVAVSGGGPVPSPFDPPTVKVDPHIMEAEARDLPGFLRTENIPDGPA